MTRLRLLHSSDLHLGKRFASLPEEVRGRLVEARHASLVTLASVAHAEGATNILLAGDTFDSETPSDAVRVQALRAMAADPELHWWILPGNHDSLRAEPLWDAVRADAPANIHLIDSPAPIALGADAYLLPAPLPHRFPGSDLTAPLVALATPEGALRIGLAHGAMASFHDDADRSALVPPDRAQTAGLDYLAMGDWHGARSIGPRTQYSGTPEQDQFKHDGRGQCLLVTFACGETPEIRPVETGRFEWRDATLALSPGLDAEAELSAALPGAESRRDTLLRLTARGTVRLAERMRLEAALARLTPEFGHLEAHLADVVTEATAGDLDDMVAGGALRAAAEDLRDAAADRSAAAEERRIASRALDRLWSLLQEPSR